MAALYLWSCRGAGLPTSGDRGTLCLPGSWERSTVDRHEPPHGEFERVAELFEEARALSAEERGAWLTRLASAEPRLAEQVRRLLGHHEADEAAVDTLKTTWRDHVAEGASFGPYTIVRELGRGGMGVVYLADQTEPLKRRVALKVIQAGLWGPDVARRFDRERQTLARLVHPGIAQVHDAGVTDDGRPYVVLEYVDGEPIHTFAREHELDLPARLELFVDVCRAVEFAHQKGVIHRDLKPGNI
ncbi:MAG: serine/threonine protein kinase, partial [Planctomycetes bacterium]|nr:serine/threonine protein kinase [Planctomycetota bacterium]